MNPTELERLAAMRRIAEKRSTQRETATLLNLSVRQVERLYAKFRSSGAADLASKRRGAPSNRRLDAALREAVVSTVRQRYADFGPTLAQEKLIEGNEYAPCVETLRRWMMDDGLWLTRKQKRKRPQQPRHRRDCRGELIQIDGCDHEWFEDRGPRCTLLVYVDDATSELMELRFVRSESTFDYFAATRSYLSCHGKPVAFYSDKASVFRVNAKDPKSGDGFTQFGRAMSTLNIDTICANSPAAKGRVERANLTLQDRLVKELRLEGISDRDAGNAFLPKFMAVYNKKFGKPPRVAHDAHRPLGEHEQLDEVFTWQEDRRLTNNLTLHYKRVMYLVTPCPVSEEARGGRVQVSETEDGEVVISYCGNVLASRAFEKDARVRQGAVVDNKMLGDAFEVIQKQQRVRDAEVLRQKKLTLREEDLMRKAMGAPGLPHRRKDMAQAEKKPGAAGSSTTAVDDLLAAALSHAPTAQYRRMRTT